MIWLRTFFKRLFCLHDWQQQEEHVELAEMGVYMLKCSKCEAECFDDDFKY